MEMASGRKGPPESVAASAGDRQRWEAVRLAALPAEELPGTFSLGCKKSQTVNNTRIIGVKLIGLEQGSFGLLAPSEMLKYQPIKVVFPDELLAHKIVYEPSGL